ncbi:MAG TPA: hypothetical protein VHF01_04715, partial [Candidatus Acidoferrum sp.]|nr:hypothetical protein [Candidatus Acidoferrum sp.]
MARSPHEHQMMAVALRVSNATSPKNLKNHPLVWEKKLYFMRSRKEQDVFQRESSNSIAKGWYPSSSKVLARVSANNKLPLIVRHPEKRDDIQGCAAC